MSYQFRTVNIWHKLAILSLAFGFFMVGLDRVPVPTVDGAVRAAMARNIVTNNQLWPITYEGRVFTDHPPLFLWLTALSYKIFGINDFAANLIPRLFAFLTVFMTALIAIESGLGAGTALASVIILCLTRDFVLSSVRGYIEPLLEFWIYLGLYFTLRQKNRRKLWPAATAAGAVWLAAYSKGPVALWPFIFFLILLVWNAPTIRRRVHLANIYLGTFVLCTMAWALWVSTRGEWQYWNNYFFGQIISSALKGRDGAQTMEPLFFLKILGKFYWPWLPFLMWSMYRIFRAIFSLEFSSRISYSLVYFLMGFGFVAGFSLMKWKFWYYIAPAYPAFALFIATVLHEYFDKIFDRPVFGRQVFTVAAIWIFIGSVYPIPLHKDRVPEVLAFKDTIVNSPVTGPVWFVRDPMDHNMVGTSGQWYFNRMVVKVTDDEEQSWAASKLVAPAWIITGSEFWTTCKVTWCTKSTLIQSAGKSSLVYYSGR